MPKDVSGVLCHILRVMEHMSVFKVALLLKEASLFTVFVETQNFDTGWGLRIAFN